MCVPSSLGIKNSVSFWLVLLSSSRCLYLAFIVFFAAVFFAAGFLVTPSAAGFRLPLPA
jgi:hypothetical protein